MEKRELITEEEIEYVDISTGLWREKNYHKIIPFAPAVEWPFKEALPQAKIINEKLFKDLDKVIKELMEINNAGTSKRYAK